MSRTHHHNKHLRDMNLHHIIWQCNKDWANINEPENKRIVEITKHEALNCLMKHNQEPQKQLEVMYNEWWKGVLSTKADELIKALIAMPREEFYHKFMLKWNENKWK